MLLINLQMRVYTALMLFTLLISLLLQLPGL